MHSTCMKGFVTQFSECIAQFVQGGTVGIKVDDDIRDNFQTEEALRQSDLMSLILFNIIALILAILIVHAKQDMQCLNLSRIW